MQRCGNFEVIFSWCSWDVLNHFSACRNKDRNWWKKSQNVFFRWGIELNMGFFLAWLSLDVCRAVRKVSTYSSAHPFTYKICFWWPVIPTWAFWGGKKELEEIKTGIGGKTVKRFSSVGGWKWTWDFFVHARRNNDRNFAEKKSKGFLQLGDGIEPRIL